MEFLVSNKVHVFIWSQYLLLCQRASSRLWAYLLQILFKSVTSLNQSCLVVAKLYLIKLKELLSSLRKENKLREKYMRRQYLLSYLNGVWYFCSCSICFVLDNVFRFRVFKKAWDAFLPTADPSTSKGLQHWQQGKIFSPNQKVKTG